MKQFQFGRGRRTHRDIGTGSLLYQVELLEDRRMLSAVGPPAKLVFTSLPANVAVLANCTATVAIEDASGNVVTNDFTQITASFASGPANGGSIFISGNAAFGIAKIKLVFGRSGVYTLRATDSSDSLSVVSASFTVNPGPPNQLVVLQQPTGANFGMTVEEVDQFQNVVTNETRTATISNTVSSQPLIGALTVPFINGIATFTNLSYSGYKVRETLVVTAGSLTVSSNSFTLMAPPAKLDFVSQPRGSQGGYITPIYCLVAVEDQYGEVEVNDSSSLLTVAVNTGPAGAILTSPTSVQASNGYFALENPLGNIDGNYTIVVRDGSLPPTISNSFTVAEHAAGITFSTQPANATTTAVLPTVKVNMWVSIGGWPTYSSSVTLAIASGPVGAKLGGTITQSGMATVSFADLTLNVPGTYTLVATDGSLPPVISQSFTITGPNPSLPAKIVFGNVPASGVAGNPLTPAVTVLVEDEAGQVVTTDNSTVSLGLQSYPTNGQLAGIHSVQAVNGVATFTDVLLETPGMYTLNAVDGSLPNAVSNSITVSPATPTKLAIAIQPSTQVAGKAPASEMAVYVESSNGTIISGDSSAMTLQIASGPSGAALGGTFTVNAVNGIAIFSNFTLNMAGTYTLRAIDGSLASVTTSSFSVTGVSATKVVIATKPVSRVAGKTGATALRAYVEDSSGKIIATDASTLSLAIASGPAGGALTGTITAKAVNGVAIFGGFLLTKAGTYTLRVLDGILSGGTSTAFTVSPAAAVKLAFVKQPGLGTHGKALSPAVTVSVLDSYGNVVTSNKSTIKLSIASGPAGSILSGIFSVADINGMAAFTDLLLNKAGTYTLRATDGTYSLALSASFKIS